MKSLGADWRPAAGPIVYQAIPIRPFARDGHRGAGKIKDVEVLRPYNDLFNRLRSDRDGIVSYSAGLIADKLAALEGEQPVGQEESDDHE